MMNGLVGDHKKRGDYMKKEDKISLTLLVVIIPILFNLLLRLTAGTLNLSLTISQARNLLLFALLFAVAIVLPFKEKILQNKFYTYFKKPVLLSIRTFKEWKLLIKGISIDILTWSSIALIIFLAVKFVNWNFSFFGQMESLVNLAQGVVQTGNPALQQELAANSGNIRNAIMFSGIGIIVAYLLAILSIGYFQGLLYSKFTKQKFDKKYIKKFLILNLVLFLSLTFLIILTIITMKDKAAAYTIIFLFLLFSYLALISFSLFAREEKILKMIKLSLRFAFKKVYLFFTPFVIAYTFIIFLFFIVGFSRPILSEKILAFVYASIIIVFITWLKFFSVKVVESVKK